MSIAFDSRGGMSPHDRHTLALVGAPAMNDATPATPFESYTRELAPRAERAAAQLLVEALVAAGVDTFFGVPGGPIMPVFDAIVRTEGATLIESRHENGAGFSAAGYHRATGKVPALVVTAGPGATNVVTPIVSAHLERVPMLVICGDVAWGAGGGRLLQDTGPEGIGFEAMVARVTRAAIRVAQAKSATSQALAALDAATDPRRPGPALLVLPIERGAASVPEVWVERGRVEAVSRASARAVRETGRILAAAERPLLVLGAGCRPHAAAVRRLVDVLDVPFVTTPQAKGVVSELHPRSLRNAGLAASWWARRYTAPGVDAALVLGTDLDDCATGPIKPVAAGGKLVHVDLDATVFNRNHPTHLGVAADLGDFTEQLYDQVTREGLRNGRCAPLLREVRSTSPFDVPDHATDPGTPIAPHRVIAELEAAAGPSARFVTDIGEHMLFALHYLTARDPEAFTIHLGLGSMGSGIASAIGLAAGDPSRRVVCVCGDGGMQMAGMEALVALQRRLPVVYAVFNDGRYNMVYHGYRQTFGRTEAWDAPFVDFAAWARALGLPSAIVDGPGQITTELLDRGNGGPLVLDIRQDASIRVRGAGRGEALQHMSMPKA